MSTSRSLSFSDSTKHIFSGLGGYVVNKLSNLKDYLPSIPRYSSPYNLSTLISLLSLPISVLSDAVIEQVEKVQTDYFTADSGIFQLLTSPFFVAADEMLDNLSHGFCNATSISLPSNFTFDALKTWESAEGVFLAKLSQAKEGPIAEKAAECITSLINAIVNDVVIHPPNNPQDKDQQSWIPGTVLGSIVVLMLIGSAIGTYVATHCDNANQNNMPPMGPAPAPAQQSQPNGRMVLP